LRREGICVGRHRVRRLMHLMGLEATEVEITTLDRLLPGKGPNAQKLLSCYILKIARLGGYLARAQDPPRGSMVIWRGWARLNDIVLGVTVTTDTYG